MTQLLGLAGKGLIMMNEISKFKLKEISTIYLFQPNVCRKYLSYFRQSA